MDNKRTLTSPRVAVPKPRPDPRHKLHVLHALYDRLDLLARQEFGSIGVAVFNDVLELSRAELNKPVEAAGANYQELMYYRNKHLQKDIKRKVV